MALRDKDREQDKPAADLLRRSLASPAGAPGLDVDPCPDPEILAAYFERSLDADETARYELHFSRCARCREMLAAMVHAGEPAGAAGEKRARSSSTAWAWDWRWLAPVAAALVLAAIVVVRRPALVIGPHWSRPSGRVISVGPNLRRRNPRARRVIPLPAYLQSLAYSSVPRRISIQRSRKSRRPRNQRRHLAHETKEFGANLSLSGRNYEQLDTLKKSAVAPKADSSEPRGYGVGQGAGNGVGIPSSAETVTVESAIRPVAPAPPPPAAAPVPPEISAANAIGGGCTCRSICAQGRQRAGN